MNKCRHKPVLNRICIGLFFCFIAACGPIDQENRQEDQGWSCDSTRDGWRRCDGDSILWCHVGSDGDGRESSGHFHEAVNCAQDGFECIALTDKLAACADASRPCKTGFAECDGRQALNCVDGKTTSMRCSLAQTCQIGSEGARCQPKQED